jgi:hypothetical protein
MTEPNRELMRALANEPDWGKLADDLDAVEDWIQRWDDEPGHVVRAAAVHLARIVVGAAVAGADNNAQIRLFGLCDDAELRAWIQLICIEFCIEPEREQARGCKGTA